MDNSISHEKKQSLKNKITNSRKAIESLLKQFKYAEDISHTENMKKLCKCLENVINVDSLYDFNKYLSNQEHLPIEINFKCLKYEKLLEMFEDWLTTKEDTGSVGLDRTLTHKHRNILFKRIFLEEQETVKDYFQTCSSGKKKLKGFDLFSLITQLFGSYYLYEFNADSQTFFDKVGSFQSFMKIVDSYVKNGQRIYTKDRSQPNDELYIRLHQLEALIEFWQIVNPELTIQENARKNMIDSSIQTILVNSTSVEVQTDRQNSKGLINIINRSLHEINGLIETENDPEMLKSLDKILQVLRTQKIFAVTYNSYLQQKKLNRNHRGMISSDFSETQPLLFENNLKTRLFSPSKNRSPQKILPHNILENYPEKQEDGLKIIYKYLCGHDKLNCLTIDILHKFFCEMGIIGQTETFLVNKLLTLGFIQYKEDINFKQFKTIMRQLMKEDSKINSQTIKNYISSYIEQNIKKTAYFKNNESTSRSHSQSLLNQSLLNIRSFREESRTTFPMDSDGSLN